MVRGPGPGPYGPIWAHMGPYTRKFPKIPRDVRVQGCLLLFTWHRTRFGGEPFGEPEPGGLPSLLLEFMVDDTRHTAEITHKPLGISFDNCTPLTVTKVVANGTGAQAGIQVGWVIRRIGGMSLVGMDYDAVVELLLKGIERLPERLPHDYSKAVESPGAARW